MNVDRRETKINVDRRETKINVDAIRILTVN